MPSFNIGDFVCLVVDSPDDSSVLRKGHSGIVCHINNRYAKRIGVCWDLETSYGELHSCDYHCERGFGWYVHEDEIELCDKNLDKDFELSLMKLIGG